MDDVGTAGRHSYGKYVSTTAACWNNTVCINNVVQFYHFARRNKCQPKSVSLANKRRNHNTLYVSAGKVGFAVGGIYVCYRRARFIGYIVLLYNDLSWKEVGKFQVSGFRFQVSGL